MPCPRQSCLSNHRPPQTLPQTVHDLHGYTYIHNTLMVHSQAYIIYWWYWPVMVLTHVGLTHEMMMDWLMKPLVPLGFMEPLDHHHTTRCVHDVLMVHSQALHHWNPLTPLGIMGVTSMIPLKPPLVQYYSTWCSSVDRAFEACTNYTCFVYDLRGTSAIVTFINAIFLMALLWAPSPGLFSCWGV